jgi:CubicO group peptidase (beta-lactamase class C family)
MIGESMTPLTWVKKMRRPIGFLLGLVLAHAATAAQTVLSSTALNSSLRTVFSESKVPALTIGVWQNGAPLYQLTQGVQSLGTFAKATDTDLWHLGSCAKSFTATMVLRLVDRGILRLAQPISENLPPILLPYLHPELYKATLYQLLSHSAGVHEDDFLTGLSGPATRRFLDIPDTQLRLLLQATSHAIQQRPTFTPGKAFHYSNYGYLAAAVIATHATGKSWMQLINEEVFEPLNMKTAGFGIPKDSATATQPRGHKLHYQWFIRARLMPMQPDDPNADLPSFYGPAGLMHASLNDWAKFCQMLLEGMQGRSTHLSRSSFQAMLTPKIFANSAEYGLGIQIFAHPKSNRITLTHTGSNGLSRARFLIDTSTQRITLMAANSGTDDVDAIFEEAQKRIANY